MLKHSLSFAYKTDTIFYYCLTKKLRMLECTFHQSIKSPLQNCMFYLKQSTREFNTIIIYMCLFDLPIFVSPRGKMCQDMSLCTCVFTCSILKVQCIKVITFCLIHGRTHSTGAFDGNAAPLDPFMSNTQVHINPWSSMPTNTLPRSGIFCIL